MQREMIVSRAIPALAPAVFVFSPVAIADPTIEDYKTAHDATFMKTYIKGLGDGLSWANAELTSQKKTLIYCVPGKLGLNTDNYTALLDEYLKDKKLPTETPVGVVLLRALEEAFPCQ